MSMALLIVDLQNWFLEVGDPAKREAVPTLLANANALLDMFHARALPVIRVQTRHKADGSTWSRWMKENQAPVLIEGTRDVEEHPDLHGASRDIIVVKTQFNAFLRTDLESVLNRLGADTLVLAGFSINACVGLTALDAFQRGYRVVLAGEAILGTSPARGQLMLDYLRECMEMTPLSNEAIFRMIQSAPEVARPESGAPRLHPVGEGLGLRLFRPEDAEELCGVVDANRRHLREWLPWLDANTNVVHFRDFIESTRRQLATDGSTAYAVLLEDRIVGVAGYHAIRPENRSVGLGYWLAEALSGRGIMTRCCAFLVNHAFDVLNLNRVEIGAAVENRRSRAIPERLGFAMEGITRDAEWLYDHFVDHVRYATLKRDWPMKEPRSCCPPNES